MRLRCPGLARLAATALALLAIAAPNAVAAPADDLRDAQKLYGQGKLQPALDKIEIFLKAQPRDPQGRFLKGLVLTEQKRTADAIQVFTGLTEDFPELPEPYNNLAVLYASQGNYEKAKSALELAIHTHPSYATAHENLGDIYAQLASRAYDRALSLDKNNTTAQVKLSMVKDLFTSQKIAAAKIEPPKADPAKATPPKDPPKVEALKADPVKADPVKADPVKADPVKADPPKADPAKVAAASGDEAGRIGTMLQAWAAAWSARDVKTYLAFYAPEFEPPGGESRAAWEKARADRIRAPKVIEVGVQVKSVKVTGNEAVVVVRQNYRSDALKSNNTKTFRLLKTGDQWRIRQEQAAK